MKNRIVKKLHAVADSIKNLIDFDNSLLDQYADANKTALFQRAFTKTNPLVSICVATYNREKLLLERTLPSILNQSYKNIEVIIVGDQCSDNTFNALAKINDNRLVTHNLSKRGQYPKQKRYRWMVAGTKPINHALTIAQGDFITHLDDDDEYTHDRIEKLLSFAQQGKYDFLWHPFYMQDPDLNWYKRDCPDFQKGSITTSSCFYHHWFKNIHWDINAWKLHEPGDWNRFRKIRHLKPNAALYDSPLLYHYREMSQ